MAGKKPEDQNEKPINGKHVEKEKITNITIKPKRNLIAAPVVVIPPERRRRRAERGQKDKERKERILKKVEQFQETKENRDDWKNAIINGLYPKAKSVDFEEWVSAFVHWQGLDVPLGNRDNCIDGDALSASKIVATLQYCITNRTPEELKAFLNREPNGETTGMHFLKGLEKRFLLELVIDCKKNNELHSTLEDILSQYTPEQITFTRDTPYEELLAYDSIDDFFEKNEEAINLLKLTKTQNGEGKGNDSRISRSAKGSRKPPKPSL